VIDRRGFTLIELVVVLAIIGIVMMVVVPRLPSSDSENLKISARTLASTLRYMQDRAATARTTYFLNVEPGTDIVRIFEAAADGSDKSPDDPLLKQKAIKDGIIVYDVIIPRIGKISDGQLRLTVGMGGLRDFSVIHLQSPDGTFWTVMAFPPAARVQKCTKAIRRHRCEKYLPPDAGSV